jgi:hypothetical protein
MVFKQEYMKWLKPILMVCLFLTVVFPACVKNTVSVNYVGTKKGPEIILPKPIVKKGEPFVVSTNGQDPGSVIKWAIRPSSGTELIPNGNEATISISAAGSYLITADFYSPTDTVIAFDSTHSTVIVNDSAYSAPGAGYDTVPLAGGELTIVPSSNSGNLQFLVKTTKNYNCSSNISATGFWQYTGIQPSTINFYFDSATVLISKADCGGAQNPATINLFPTPLTTGPYQIYAVLTQNPRQYFQGTLNVTDSDYTFTWNYSSGIIISPKQIKKN